MAPSGLPLLRKPPRSVRSRSTSTGASQEVTGTGRATERISTPAQIDCRRFAARSGFFSADIAKCRFVHAPAPPHPAVMRGAIADDLAACLGTAAQRVTLPPVGGRAIAHDSPEAALRLDRRTVVGTDTHQTRSVSLP